jgi:hypothetical protein
MQQRFLDAMLVEKWTTPRGDLGEADALRIGRQVGLNPILVCEFLYYWIGSGDLDESWAPIAAQIQASLGDTPTEQIESRFPLEERSGSKPLVFLCHASEDKAAVRNYGSMLKSAGFDTWLDQDDILPGRDWDVEIRKAIKLASAVVIFLSTRSRKRGYLQKEILRVVEEAEHQPPGTIFVIPAKIEPCEVPDQFSKLQYVDLSTPRGFEKLCRALDTHRGTSI